MDDPAASLLHVDAFGGGIGGQKQPHGGGRVLELGLHRLELIDIHAAVEEPQRVLVEAFLKKPLFQVEQRLLVLGEDDQPLVVPQLAAGEQVLLDPATRASVLESDFLAMQRACRGLRRSSGRSRGLPGLDSPFAVSPRSSDSGSENRPRCIGPHLLRGPISRRRSCSVLRHAPPRHGPCRRGCRVSVPSRPPGAATTSGRKRAGTTAAAWSARSR